MKVKDIMTSEVLSANPETKVTDVAKIFTENRIHAVPVIENQKVIGIITESDFFIKGLSNMYLPTYIDFLMKGRAGENLTEKQKLKIDKLLGSRAEDIMSTDCFTISYNAEVSELIDVFREKRLFTLPVVDENNNLIGIVAQADIIKLL